MATREEYLKKRRESSQEIGISMAKDYAAGGLARDICKNYTNPLTGKTYSENYVRLQYQRYKHLL